MQEIVIYDVCINLACLPRCVAEKAKYTFLGQAHFRVY